MIASDITGLDTRVVFSKCEESRELVEKYDPFMLGHPCHNIIQIHNNVMWDQQYFTEYSSHSD